MMDDLIKDYETINKRNDNFVVLISKNNN